MFKWHYSLKECLAEISAVIKRLGIPFIIFGLSFIYYSWKINSPIIPFSYFMIVFLFLALLQTMFENVWLAKEIEKLNKRIEEIEKVYKAK
ncbi:hypothetical protein SAMN02745883_01470 [Caminicella sporogenes DSM 14501]|uniref:Uncharacterized protein n=1 Tax=Caminicella sporogenes DSM 14501 TaxID=1121266 RepID=A0A1M6QEU5_9FIRM|nr:hypothetical protein [Caminicella sporogenes]RKD25339.1 hypothetical protein BET04_03770 [Caminicella sporogenes]WIF95336.1 hypothetical protein QNI18_01475 [Caminicella sporogenes]SHK18698.1 hypothetical protein SAMN02745883_01470 [Caminicella sporogenes DSM 14501]